MKKADISRLLYTQEKGNYMPTESYRVVREIDIKADSPEEAAAQALIVHRDLESTATMFTVVDSDGMAKDVDLDTS